MTEYRVHFTQTFKATGWRTTESENEDGAAQAVLDELMTDPAIFEIDDDGDVDIDDVEEVTKG